MTISQGSQAAVEADEIVEAIKAETERQRREKQADTQSVTMKQPISQLIDEQVDYNKDRTDTKLATTFNTNRTYINEAARLKQGREKKKEEGKLYGRGNTKDEKVLSIIDRTFNEKETHNTQKIIAEEIGKSTGWVGMAEVEADEIVEAIKAETERQRREKQAANAANQYTEPSNNLLLQPTDPNTNATATKLATNFNTNRTYINEAARLKQGREKMIISGSDGGRGNKKEINPLSIIDRPFNEKETHNTQSTF